MIPPPGRTATQIPGGTCASMPVLYTAVGRRLGYPLRLVETRGHLFVRWDGLDHPYVPWRQRFNIEGSGEGFSTPDDDHYKSWPYKLTDEDVRRNRYLISLSPAEELAGFLAARGHCGQDNDQWAFATHSYELAARLDPRRPGYVGWLIDASMRSGYRPAMPQLARLVDNRVTMLEALAEQHSARREMDPLRSDSRDATHRRVTAGWPGQPEASRDSTSRGVTAETRFIDIPAQPPMAINAHLANTGVQTDDPYAHRAQIPSAPYTAPPVQPFDPHPQPLPFRSRP